MRGDLREAGAAVRRRAGAGAGVLQRASVMSRGRIALALLAFSLAACGGDGPAAPGDGAFVWRLPPKFPEPKVPASNPMTTERVELGRHLVYDVRLSVNGPVNCASCPGPARAF